MTSPWVARMQRPPRVAMLRHRLLEPGAAGGIEPDARLVEQPERARHRQQAGEVGAALLAGGQETNRGLGQPVEIEAGEGRREVGLPVGEARGEGEVLGHGQQRLQRVGVADEVQAAALLDIGRRDGAAGPGERARTRSQEARQQPQQRRLATAVGAAQDQGIAGGELERQVREHQTPAAVAGQLAGGEQGGLSGDRR